MTAHPHTARVLAGVPATDMWLYRRMRFLVGDPAAWIELPGGDTLLIVRDIEMARAKRHARADRVHCPADFPITGGLSPDREVATAQSLAACLVQHGVSHVVAGRSLPLLYAEECRQMGLHVDCDPFWGVDERRMKDAEEVGHLRRAQEVTESVMRSACEMIGTAQADADGRLTHEGNPLTSERVRALIDRLLAERGFRSRPAIVAGGAHGGDCHEKGTGVLRTGQPVIVDIFPQDSETLYNGDCTRTVVHGDVPEAVAAMHAAVLDAKAAAIAHTKAGVTAESVHEAAVARIRAAGYHIGLPPADAPASFASMPHGTGHGIGLDVHEPPLLDKGGPQLLAGDVLTIEPGVYSKAVGGVRVEDMVIVTETGCDNLNTLPDGLTWA